MVGDVANDWRRLWFQRAINSCVGDIWQFWPYDQIWEVSLTAWWIIEFWKCSVLEFKSRKVNSCFLRILHVQWTTILKQKTRSHWSPCKTLIRCRFCGFSQQKYLLDLLPQTIAVATTPSSAGYPSMWRGQGWKAIENHWQVKLAETTQ